MLHSLADIAIVLILAVAVAAASRIEAEDPAWAARWDALSPADRARISAAVRSGSLLADPEEIDLAAGIARRYRRLSIPCRLATAVDIPVGAGLIAAGLVDDSIFLIVAGAVFLLLGVWRLGRSHEVNRNLREAIDRDHHLLATEEK